MKATVRRFHSPDVYDLESWTPEDESCFGFLLQVLIGPKNGRGEESVDFIVCTPDWLGRYYMDDDVVFVKNHIVVSSYDFGKISSKIRQLVENIGGETWNEIAERIGRYGKWEFEDYDC